MRLEERMVSFRLVAPAQSLRARVLEAVLRERRERRRWRWTWAVAVVVVAVAIPVNLSIKMPDIVADQSRTSLEAWPGELREYVRSPIIVAAGSPRRTPRTLEELR